MRKLVRHLAKTFIAGIVALLPIGGTIFTFVWLEATISESWLAKQSFYFPGLGLLAIVAAVYLVGLAVSSFLGRFLWATIDKLLDRVPLAGQLYRTMKQILGYGEGKDAVFEEVVLVPARNGTGEEMGLVTGHFDGDDNKLIVFVPGSPNPGNGRLVVLERALVRPLKISVHEALTALVSVGKSGISEEAVQTSEGNER